MTWILYFRSHWAFCTAKRERHLNQAFRCKEFKNSHYVYLWPIQLGVVRKVEKVTFKKNAEFQNIHLSVMWPPTAHRSPLITTRVCPQRFPGKLSPNFHRLPQGTFNTYKIRAVFTIDSEKPENPYWAAFLVFDNLHKIQLFQCIVLSDEQCYVVMFAFVSSSKVIELYSVKCMLNEKYTPKKIKENDWFLKCCCFAQSKV